MKDGIFYMRDGWYCRVNGRIFGPWICPQYARAGMQVEQRRAGIPTQEVSHARA